MKNYSIVHLDLNHLEEICQDIKMQYETGVTNMPLFCCSMVAEGNPVIDKATMFCEKYDIFRERLMKDNIPSGILVQSSIGHGPALNQLPPFQRYVGLGNGEVHYKSCPLGEGVREHFKNQLAIVASHHPDTIMIDDDVRILSNNGGGCACPAHLEEMSKILGRKVTREELFEEVKTNDDTREKYVRLMGDALIGFAKAMREGIDSVDPTIPGCYCGVGVNFEFAEEIAKIIAGEGNPVVIRVNNAKYASPGPRELSHVMYKAASHMAKVKHVADFVLAESDTCPHNRYSTGASTLHTQFTASLLEGLSGAKHWLSRSTFEPESGKAYRKKLSENLKFYEEITRFAKDLKWIGCRIPVSQNRLFDFTQHFLTVKNNWACCVLERLGLPMYFSSEAGGVTFLEEDVDKMFTDDEIKEMLSTHAVLSCEAAERLKERGFGNYLGVDVKEWDGPNMSGELMLDYKTVVNVQCGSKQIIPTDETVRVDSEVYHLRDGKYRDAIFPGCATYKNSLGGIVNTFCGVPLTPLHYTKFGFLNYSRKQQFIKLLSESGNLPVYYPGDSEILLKAAYTPQDELFVAYFNISLDCADEILLQINDKKVLSIERLMSDGTRKSCAFTQENGLVTIDSPSIVQDPALLFIKTE